MSAGVRLIGLVGMGALVILGVFGLRILQAPDRAASSAGIPSDLLGQVVPSEVLAGLAVAWRQDTADATPRPLLLYVVPVESSADCTRIPMEMRVVARRFPGIHQALVVTGPDTLHAQRFAREHRVLDWTNLDPEFRLTKAIGAHPSQPLVMLLDSDDRILFVDARSGGRFSNFPVSRLLPLLSSLLDEGRAQPIAGA